MPDQIHSRLRKLRLRHVEQFSRDGGKGQNWSAANVIYNCDVVSPLGSVWLGGMNETG